MASGKDMEDLPDELLLEIFSYFTIEDLAMRVQHVSSRWREVSLDNSLWKCKLFSPNDKVTDEEIVQHIRNMPALKVFAPNRGTNAKVLDTLCRTCKNIQQLELHWSQRLQNSIVERMLQIFPNLLVLNIPIPMKVNQLQFAELLGQFKKLTTLTFSDQCREINNGVLSIIADGCPSLVHIDLSYCTFEDQDIRQFLQKRKHDLLSISIRCYTSTLTYISLTQCIKLEKLWYENYNDDLPSSYVEHLSKLSELRELSLLYFKGTQTGNLPQIFMNKALIRLKKLQIHYCENLEPQALNRILKNCPTLQSLVIRDGGIESGFETIGNCSELEELTIECSSLEDESIQYIGTGCHKIRNLNLSYCQSLTDKAIEYICAGCSKLEFLDLTEMRELTDGIFESICKFKHLRSLTLAWQPNITGSSFHLFSEHLVQLIEFNICWCESLCKDNLERLKTEMPHVKIHEHAFNNSENESDSDIELEDAEFFITALLQCSLEE